MNNKRNQQRKHFCRRLFERFGISINDNDYNELVLSIKRQNENVCSFLFKQSNRLSVFKMRYKDTEFISVYDRTRKSLITALPANCLNAEQVYSYIVEMED